MSSVILDTGILIQDVRTKDILQSPLYELAGSFDRLLITVITDFEFKIGCATQNQRDAYVRMLELYGIQIIPLTADDAGAAAAVHLALKRSNKIIGRMDTLIAGTAIAHGLPLATLNRKHFERVADLQLV